MKGKQKQTKQRMTAVKCLLQHWALPTTPPDMRLIYDRTKIFFQAVKTIK